MPLQDLTNLPLKVPLSQGRLMVEFFLFLLLDSLVVSVIRRSGSLCHLLSVLCLFICERQKEMSLLRKGLEGSYFCPVKGLKAQTHGENEQFNSVMVSRQS